MNIGDAANAAGVSAKLIRYYESIGLIRSAGRTDSGYRVYMDIDVQTLRFIKHARSLGFSIKQIKELLALWQDRSRANSDVRAVALAHIEELDIKVAELHSMADSLRKLVASCGNGKRSDCPILEGLAETRQPSKPMTRPGESTGVATGGTAMIPGAPRWRIGRLR